MEQLVIQKIYRNAKIDKKGKSYQLVNIYSAKGVFTIFDYSNDTDGWVDGDTIDISSYEQKESEYNGKISIILSKPSKGKQEVNKLEERVAKLEERLDQFALWAKSIQNKQG